MTQDTTTTTTTSGERDTKGRWGGGGEIAENKGTPVPPQQCIDDALIDRDERHAYVVACSTRRRGGRRGGHNIEPWPESESVWMHAIKTLPPPPPSWARMTCVRASGVCGVGGGRGGGGGEGGKNTHALCATVYLAPEFEDTNLPSLRIQK